MSDYILVVEDESDISQLLSKILKNAGYQVEQAFSGSEGRLLIAQNPPDLVLMDLMLPGMNGEELLAYIREEREMTFPVIVLSAKGGLEDKVRLLQMGADDYMTKPFEPEEVLARVYAALRRAGKRGHSTETIGYKELKIYPESMKVMAGEQEIFLTGHEYELLYLLMKHPGKVYSRQSLYELIWQGGYYGENNTVNVHISNLRKKMKEAGLKEEYIQTVYGIGLKLK